MSRLETDRVDQRRFVKILISHSDFIAFVRCLKQCMVAHKIEAKPPTLEPN